MASLRILKSAVLLTFVLMSCEETLPLRNDPMNLFVSRFSAVYTLSATQNDITFFLVIKNNYDEVLQGQSALRGTLYLEWISKPEDRGPINPVRTVTLSPSNLIHVTSFDPFGGTLTIDPGDSIVMMYRWNYKTDDSTNVRNYFKMNPDYTCSYQVGDHAQYRRYSKQTIAVRGQLKLFDKTASITPRDYMFPFCFQDVYKPKNLCPTLNCD